MQEARVISTLSAKVTRDQAIKAFKGTGLLALWRQARLGPLRSLADIYIPFALQKVALTSGRIRGQQILAIDTVSGTLDPYEFDEVPNQDNLAQVCTSNYLPTQLTTHQISASALSMARRQLYSRGFFRLRGDLQLGIEPLGIEVFIPFWVGFFAVGDHVEMIAMDAVRRQIEGAKVKSLLRDWIGSYPPN